MIRQITETLGGTVTQFVTEESVEDGQQWAVTSLYVTLLQTMVTRLITNPGTKVVHICMNGQYPEEHLQNILKLLSFDIDGKKSSLDEKTKNAIIGNIWLAYPEDMDESHKQLDQLEAEGFGDLSKLVIIIQGLDDMTELHAFRDFTSACAVMMNFMLKLRKLSQLGATVMVSNTKHTSGVSMIFSYIDKFYDNKLTFKVQNKTVLLECHPLTISTKLQFGSTPFPTNLRKMYQMYINRVDHPLINT